MTRSSLIPGFRFHPTDVELVMYYLKRKLLGKKIIINAVAEVNIYDFGPWDLPDKSSLRSGDLEWFFFCPKARKYASGSRANRATETGFWKATGKDRPVKYKERTVAMIKTLVFHLGNAPNGKRTDWVMHEYCMKDDHLANEGIVQDAYVLCKIFQKSGAGPKNGAQYGAPFNEEEYDDDGDVASCFEPQAVIGPGGTTNTPNCKLNDSATMTPAEPTSSIVTFSANETTNGQNHKQKGPATMNTTEPGSSMVTFSANETKNGWNHKQKGPATMGMTEPGPSTIMVSANERCPNVPANDDMLFLEDIDLIMGESSNNDNDGLFSEDFATIMGASTEDDVNGNNKKEGVEKGKSVAANEENGIYDNLDDLFNLDDLEFKTDGAEYDLRNFYVD